MDFAAAAWTRLRAALAQRREAVAAALHAAGGFLMSASPLLAGAPPFGLAFAGAALGGRMLWAAAGAIFGYLTQADPAVSVRWIAAVVLLCGLRWAFSFAEPARLALYTPLLAALSCAVTGMAVVIGGGEGSPLLVLSESAVTAAAGILFSRGLRAIAAAEPLAGTAAIGVGTLAGVLLTGAAAVWGGPFPPVYIAVLWLVLCVASYSRAGQALLLAGASGVAAAFAGDGALLLTFSSGALAAAAFAPLGRLFTGMSLALAGSLALLFCGAPGRVLPYLGACAVAGGLWLVTPLSALRALGLLSLGESVRGEMLRRLLQTRLCAVRGALDSIAVTTRAVSERLERASGDRAQAMIDGVCGEVCGGCARRASCWSRYDDCIRACSEVFFGGAQTLSPRVDCPREALLCTALRRAGARYASRRELQREAGRLRGPAADQFEGTSLLLASLQQELDRLCCADEGLCDRVRQTLAALGAEPVSAACFETQQGLPLLLAEVPAHCVARLDPQAAAAALSELVCRPLGPAEATAQGALTSLVWQAQPPAAASLCWRSRSADGAGPCGDCCAAFECGAGEAVLLLCDGMGTGGAAAVDAAMTVSLFTELLKAGVRFEAALRIVSAALLSRGGERLCTVDAAVIDLFGLRLESCKAGAAPSYLLRGGRVRRIGANGLPIGILGGVEAARTELTLQPGDVLVLVSDGLTDDGDEWLPSQIAAAGGGDLEALCDALLQTAAARRAGRRADDCSVLAARIDRAGA